jgi:Skp family chaperone for outer membrane proteins
MKSTTLALALSALIAATPAAAQTPPPARPPQTPPAQTAPPPLLPPQAQPAKPAPVPFPADSKIAFVSLQQVVAESALGKAGQKQMQDLQNKKAAEMQDRSKKIQTLQQEIQSQSGVLSQSALAAKNTELERLQREAQFAQQDAQSEVDNLNQQLLQNFKDKVLPIIEQLRTEKNLWAIFSADDSGVAAFHPGLDLSIELTKRLDAKEPGIKK